MDLFENPRTRYLIAVLGLALVTILVYYGGLSGEFVMDDWPIIRENPKLGSWQYIPDFFTSGVWVNSAFALNDKFLYRPLFLLTVFLNHQVWGDNPLGYHVFNLVLHLANTLLVFHLLRTLVRRGGDTGALLGALLFAVHPVHVESVTWISGLTDPLVALLLLSSLAAYRRFLEKQAIPWLWLSLLLFALALFSKEVAATFPVLLLAHDFLYRRKIGYKRLLLFFGVLAVYFLLRRYALGHTGSWERFSFDKWGYVAEFLAGYLQLLFVPWPLEYYYRVPDFAAAGLVLGGLLILAALVTLPRGLRDDNRPYLFGVVWFGLTLLPALSLALFTHPIFASRFLYLPSVGLSIFAAWLYGSIAHRWKTAAILAYAAFIVVFAVATIDETADWRDDGVFYRKAIEVSPDFAGTYEGLARYEQRNGRSERAIELYQQAVAKADSPKERLNDLEQIGLIYGMAGDTKRSEHYYRQVVEGDPKRSTAWVGLGNNAWQRQDFPAALGYYRKAYESDPGNYEACYNLALLYRKMGDQKMAAFYGALANRLRPSR